MSDFPVPEPAADVPADLSSDEPLDIQHDTDPAQDHGGGRRIPNLGHALSFFSVAFLALQLGLTLAFDAAHIPVEAMGSHPGIGLAGEAFAWVLALLVSSWLFPRQWRRPFLDGLQWNASMLRRRWYWVVGAGVLLSLAAQGAEHFVKVPDEDVVGKLMSTPHGAWLVTLFGVVIAPVMEETAFRGFLMPALATMYDWLSLDRTPAGVQRWETTTGNTTSGLMFGAIFSSIPFALFHAEQLRGAWGAVGILFGLSLALSFTRARTHSVACSAAMHAVYNLSGFAAFFVATGGYRHLEKL